MIVPKVIQTLQGVLCDCEVKQQCVQSSVKLVNIADLYDKNQLSLYVYIQHLFLCLFGVGEAICLAIQ